jgi:hypothetical protein
MILNIFNRNKKKKHKQNRKSTRVKVANKYFETPVHIDAFLRIVFFFENDRT